MSGKHGLSIAGAMCEIPVSSVGNASTDLDKNFSLFFLRQSEVLFYETFCTLALQRWRIFCAATNFPLRESINGKIPGASVANRVA